MTEELRKIRDLLGLTNIPLKDLRIEKPKMKWDHTFLLEALLASYRSHDANTQCGCVIVKDNTILSSGYNGFIRGIDDNALPNIRPYKYPYMLHAELNAVLNCSRQGKSTLGATAYITTKPCLSCFQMLWQAGIVRIVHSNLSISQRYNNEEEARQIEALLLLINHGMIRGGDRNLTLHEIPTEDIDFSPIIQIFFQIPVDKKVI